MLFVSELLAVFLVCLFPFIEFEWAGFSLMQITLELEVNDYIWIIEISLYQFFFFFLLNAAFDF